MKKKIIYIHEYNGDLEFYKKSSFWKEILTSLNKHYKVYSIVFNQNIKEEQTINIYNSGIEATVLKWNITNIYRPWSNVYSTVLDYLKKNKLSVDLIYLQNTAQFGFPALKLKKELNIPLIIHEHTAYYKENIDGTIKIGIHKIFDFYRFIILNRAENVIVPSSFLKHQIDKYKYINNKREIDVVNNPISNVFVQNHISEIKENKGNPVAIATWNLVKNLPRLVRSLNLLNETYNKNLKIEVIGYVYPKVIESLVKLDTNNINFIGAIDHESFIEYLKKAPYLILSSNLETFSLPVIESMSMGIPVVSTKCGAPEYLLSEGRGILSNQNDDDFCDSINKMDDIYMEFNQTELRNWVIDNMSYEIVGNQLKEIVDDIIKAN